VKFQEISSRINFWPQADRIGPDIPYAHWKLYFKSSMQNLCQKKFKSFHERAEFQPGAYAEACSKIEIGKNVVIRPGTFLFADPTPKGSGICIRDDVLIGSGVHMYTNNHSFADTMVPIIQQGYPPASESDSIVIETGAWIGANVIIPVMPYFSIELEITSVSRISASINAA
jgi:acetyltransferase-like isoleucine patch superfamily enzyme